MFGTAAEAIEFLSVPQVKTPAAFKTFEGPLHLGDPEKYPETAIHIDVLRYFKTKTAKPVSASSFAVRGASNGGGIAQTILDGNSISGNDLSTVKTNRSYQVNAPQGEGSGGKLGVPIEELSKGYEYGRTAVHISESDENVTKLETFKGLSIIGFIPNDKVCTWCICD